MAVKIQVRYLLGCDVAGCHWGGPHCVTFYGARMYPEVSGLAAWS